MNKAHVEEFSRIVRALARTLETPNYIGQVAIGQLHEAWCERYGSVPLAEFKRWLVAGCKARRLLMMPCELPELMEPAERERSVTIWNRERVHLVSHNIRH